MNQSELKNLPCYLIISDLVDHRRGSHLLGSFAMKDRQAISFSFELIILANFESAGGAV